MYIHPFLAGVLATVGVAMFLIIIIAITQTKKETKKNGDH